MSSVSIDVRDTRAELRREAVAVHLRRRRATNRIWWVLAGIALALVLIPVISVVGGIIARAVPHWQWNALTTDTQGFGGGLENALVGTVEIVIGVAILAGAVGIAGGIYLAEFCAPGKGSVTSVTSPSSSRFIGVIRSPRP
jgi:phosphate transport system permease protein